MPPLGFPAAISHIQCAQREGQLPDKKYIRIQRLFDELERKLPSGVGRPVGWIRQPKARAARIPVGVLMVLGGVFSFLPVLGIWMLPFGLLLLAVDVPPLQGPVGSAVVNGRRKWSVWRRVRAARKAAKQP